ncbi:hypothetical protein KIPB_009571, partial [Kipferlia bialata]
FRISHDFFGAAPSMARGIEALCPPGHVTVAPVIRTILGRDNPSFVFGRKVFSTQGGTKLRDNLNRHRERERSAPVTEGSFARSAEAYKRAMSQYAGQGVLSEMAMVYTPETNPPESMPHYHITNILRDMMVDNLMGIVLMSAEERDP